MVCVGVMWLGIGEVGVGATCARGSPRFQLQVATTEVWGQLTAQRCLSAPATRCPCTRSPSSLAITHPPNLAMRRAELLVRCQGTPGDKFILTSGGFNHSSFGEGFLKTKVFMQQLNQDVVAIIQLEDAQVGR